MLNFLFIAFCVLAVFVFGFFMGKYYADKTNLDDRFERFINRVDSKIDVLLKKFKD